MRSTDELSAHPDLEMLERLSDRLAAEYLEYYAVLPLHLDEEVCTVATWQDEVDVQVLDDLHILFGRRPRLVALPESEVRPAIRRVYGGEAASAQSLIDSLPGTEDLPRGVIHALEREMPLDDLLSLANEAPVVKLVNFLLLEALEAGASDVHLEGYGDRFRVRYRIDGILQDAPSPPFHMKAAITSRLKVMAELDVSERRVPQDGRIQLRLQDRQVDVRVSTLPTLHGESVVLRLLDTDQGRVVLSELGMAEDTLAAFSRAISKPYGIVLSTGPTGSGKTTTLYAAMDLISTGREKILTVEDPVEYEIEGVPQVPVNEKVGLTFATALRALLRQDPDVLLVGEIRDEETADIATHAALTGHLVLSTLHTNDAATAITRLLDLGVAPYLVASTVEAVLAQRLVRVVCEMCKEPVAPEPERLRALGVDPDEVSQTFAGKGCDACWNTGYRGRTGVYELVVLDDTLREEIQRKRGAGELRRLAIEKGMRTLAEDGIRQVAQGCTTLEEVLRVTQAT